MNKSIGLVSLVFVCIIVLLSGCDSTATPPAPWSLVVVGDSIAITNSMTCPGCTCFVDRYADAISMATDHPVTVSNLAQPMLQVDALLRELQTHVSRRDALANADIIIVSIAFNDTPWLRNDDPCDGPNGGTPDWSKYNSTCAAAAAESLCPSFESIYAQIVALREGKPTIFLTINRYNDWIGWTGENGETNPPETTEATRVVADA